MPILFNNLTVPSLAIHKYIVSDEYCEFDYETLEELTDIYCDENNGKIFAKLNLIDDCISLTIFNVEDVHITVYYAENTQALYKTIDAKYVEIIDTMTSGNDFWDKWNAVIETFETCKIVDDRFDD